MMYEDKLERLDVFVKREIAKAPENPELKRVLNTIYSVLRGGLLEEEKTKA